MKTPDRIEYIFEAQLNYKHEIYPATKYETNAIYCRIIALFCGRKLLLSTAKQ